MGFYIKKSYGKNFRMNVSKSGLGFSAGVKGLRAHIKPNGKMGVHAGRNGLYYRKSIGSSNSDDQELPENGDGGAVLCTIVLFVCISLGVVAGSFFSLLLGALIGGFVGGVIALPIMGWIIYELVKEESGEVEVPKKPAKTETIYQVERQPLFPEDS